MHRMFTLSFYVFFYQLLRNFLSIYYTNINSRTLDSVAWSDNDLYYDSLSDRKCQHSKEYSSQFAKMKNNSVHVLITYPARTHKSIELIR